MAAEMLRTFDHFVDHVSTVPAIAGQSVQLYVREKVRADLVDKPQGAQTGAQSAFRGAVLMVHGGYWPCTPAFDLAHEDYSWMAALALRGWDVYAMDMTGYGRSPRPLMDDPRNLDPKQQPLLVPGTLTAPVAPLHPFDLVTSDSEADDIDRVVDFIRARRGLEKIHLIGWSGGGCRTGCYTGRHPEKIERLMIYASSNYRRDGSKKPDQIPKSGAPMTLQTFDDFIEKRWNPAISCPDQVAPGMKDVAWAASIASDPIGAKWGKGGLRGPSRTYWGWNRDGAAKLTLPVLVMVGDGDRLLESNRELYADLAASPKAFVEFACGSHFAQWEKPRHLMHRLSAAWLEDLTVDGFAPGVYRADGSGKVIVQT
ncbi:MAG TPA: alpha/beta fold hydrolase, partial [Alphaproteobacteria bacterium]|nr:alpha/beta fold hydrolase [Alphaproteobacteria bacterium]